MNRIRLLPETVANQIAAGEVVERPASVVKELVENALDADSQRLTVEIQAGGRSLVRVSDDGQGMSKDDALLCFERHATSKIQKAEDLYALRTMGFRGEALPSIASVSRLLLTTRERATPGDATQVVINGGKIQEVKSAGAPEGTSVEVRQLFFNLPARRKFLRSDETEASHIQHYLTLVALAYPERALTFVKDGRTVWNLPPVRQTKADRLVLLQERMRQFYGQETGLLPVDHHAQLDLGDLASDEGASDGPSDQLNLWGLIGAPGVARPTREDQHLFVNRRPVENRGLNHALLEGYHTALMKGRFPVCCLFLEIDPALVDINIHPAKKEVKFHREFSVRGAVTHAIRRTLLNFHSVQLESTTPAPPPSQPPATEADPASSHPDLPAFAITPASAPAPAADLRGFSSAQSTPPARALAMPPQAPPSSPTRSAIEAALPETAPTRQAQTPTPFAPVQLRPAPAAGLLNVPLRLIGVVGKLYVLYESDRGLVLMDQHAAHERILFEQMLRRLQTGDAPSQRLLLPVTLELGPRDAAFVKAELTTLHRLGIGIHEFGEKTFLVDALPPFVKAAEPRQFVLGLLDEIQATGQGVNSMRLGEDMIAKTVCRHAVKANDYLAPEELRALLEDLKACTMPYTCPHGRPTLIELNYAELEKKFGRIQ